MTINVSEDAIIRRRSPARVVFGLKAVDGDDDVQIGDFRPLGGDRADGAGHHLNLYPHRVEMPDETCQLPITNQRLADDDGDVKRTEAPDQPEDSLHEILAPPFPQSPDGASVA